MGELLQHLLEGSPSGVTAAAAEAMKAAGK
jgi:hypothetical protein